MQWRSKVALAVPALVAVTLATAGPSAAGRGEAGMQAVRQHTDQYHSEAAAVADGFVPTDECVPGMGYHYVNFERIDERLQPSRPEAVLYAPTEDGGRRLIAAEWIVVDDDQDLSTDHDRPTLFGHRFDGPMPGHGGDMPIHYDLHAYAWVTNPDGGFATWNPAITCP
jgi:hypothetical protein